MMEPTELYNILNQLTVYPCVSDPNYLFLVDARNDDEYEEGHIEMAKKSRKDDLDQYYLPYDAELECKTHVIVYDGNCKSKREDSCPAMVFAKLAVESGSKNPVKILRGGYEDFSALYPFLRTQKVIYMPRELDHFETYPCEIIPGMLYLGNYDQVVSDQVLKDLKVGAYLHFSIRDYIFEDNCDSKRNLQIEIDDADADSGDEFGSRASDIVEFITGNRADARVVLVSSDRGVSRSAAACILYCMKHYSWSLREAWQHVKACKHNIQPNRSLVKQLSAYEERLLNKKVTDISDPNY